MNHLLARQCLPLVIAEERDDVIPLWARSVPTERRRLKASLRRSMWMQWLALGNGCRGESPRFDAKDFDRTQEADIQKYSHRAGSCPDCDLRRHSLLGRRPTLLVGRTKVPLRLISSLLVQ